MPEATPEHRAATIVHGVLVLGAVDSRQKTTYRAELLDAAGRKMRDLRSGANDVSRLAPGVYFVRTAGGRLSAMDCHKIVIQK